MAKGKFERAMEARARRIKASDAKLEWLGANVEKLAKMSVRARLQLVGQMLRDRIVINISRPVVKTVVQGRSGGSRTVVDPNSRSRAGEFPKADTTRLMKDVFFNMEDDETVVVGVTLDYALILETRMDRSFLVRTLNEIRPALVRIVTGGI